MSSFLRQYGDTLILEVLVQPRASKTEITGIQDGKLKIRLTSPPVEGAANRLCIQFLAKLLGIPKSAVTLVAGDKSRHKRFALQGLSHQETLDRLNLPEPLS